MRSATVGTSRAASTSFFVSSSNGLAGFAVPLAGCVDPPAPLVET